MYTPWSQLPAPPPKETTYPLGYFYENTAKYLIKDTVRIMDNGLNIDLNKVIELEKNLVVQLTEVKKELAENPLIEEYLKIRYKKQIEEYVKDRKSKMRDSEYYLVPFKPKDIFHRSYFMDIYAKQQRWGSPEEKLPTGVGKWTATLVKKYAQSNRLLQMLLKGTLPTSISIVKEAMQNLARDKAKIYNEKYIAQVKKPSVPYPEFNPGSPQQKQELFAMLGIESDEFSKDTGLPKWDRAQIERVNSETTDDNVRNLTQSFIDYSFAAIVKNNFINAFYTYTVDGRLYGQYKLLGAKSARYTSEKPNMLNAPSTGSRFAKPVKECFTAPDGKLVAAIDYSALEDRVTANLSKDVNKLALFLEGLDGHSLSATYYYPERVEGLIGPYTDNKDASRELKALVDNNNKEAKSVRQDSKPVSFGLAYGAFPKKVSKTIKVPLKIAEKIFNAYHYELYPGISDFRENYVLPTAKENGFIHLGLGFNLQTDNPDQDIRTLNNGCSQFWSILTILAINKIHQLIDKAGLEEDIKVTSSIYDSLYFEITKDPVIIKWLNDHIVPIMEQDFIVDQIVKNEARLEIGSSWAELTELTKDANLDEITQVIDKYNTILDS